jgi:hypothetical protein
VRAWSGRRGDVDPSWQNMLAYHRALVETLLGEPQRVLDELGRRTGAVVSGLLGEQPSICDLIISWALTELGEPGAVAGAWAAMAVLEANENQESLPILRAIHGAACLAAGDERAIEVLVRARAEALSASEVWWLAETVRLLAEARAAAGELGEAQALAAEAEALATEQGAGLLLPRIAATRQRLAAASRAEA